jgi:hypothetical protein
MRIPIGAAVALALAWSTSAAPRAGSTAAAERSPHAAPAAGVAAAAPAADTARAAPPPHGGAQPPSPHGSPHGGTAAPSPHGSPHGGAPPASGGMAGRRFKVVIPPGSPKVRSVTLGVRHRVYHDFVDTRVVRMREPFAIGDTPFSATVLDFVPDFVLDLDAGRITSRSTEPRNPAFRIVVREEGVPTDTTWAFLNMPPHFAPKSLLAFKVMRIEFTDRPSLPDTSAARKPAARDTSRAASPQPAPDSASTGRAKP